MAVMVLGLGCVTLGMFGRRTSPFSAAGVAFLGIVLIAVSGFALLDGPN